MACSSCGTCQKLGTNSSTCVKAWCVVLFNLILRIYKIVVHLGWLLWAAVLHTVLRAALVMVWPRGAVRWPFWKLVFCTMWLNKIKDSTIRHNMAVPPGAVKKSLEAAVRDVEDMVDKAGKAPAALQVNRLGLVMCYCTAT